MSKPKQKEINGIKPMEEDTDPFRCCSCGKKYNKQVGYFSHSQSALYKGNNSFLPICNNCLENLVEQYIEIIGDKDKAIERVCLHWDIYYDDKILSAVKNSKIGQSRIKNYIRVCNLQQNSGKTYDTTLQGYTGEKIETIRDLKESTDRKVPQKIVKFFGLGYTNEQYEYLQDQYNDWIHRHQCETKAQEELFKNLAIAQLNINIAQQSKNGKVSEAMRTFNDLLGSANLKPSQTNDNSLVDNNAFGTLIKKWENTRPISEPDPQWKDVDGIIRHISVYFLGHLCKMLGVKNKYSKMYEDEMTKYRVEKPEYEGDDEALFDAVFNEVSHGDD